MHEASLWDSKVRVRCLIVRLNLCLLSSRLEGLCTAALSPARSLPRLPEYLSASRQPFRLAGPTQTGRRKTLTSFNFVNPNTAIPSVRTLGPQQEACIRARSDLQYTANFPSNCDI
ncbi:hypothetical protein DAEQUDRAFT_730055 [Daedalea quercina L-15889]|uniref:Uncharacterized protein n=1 Tax=Daedalea quercina L-15889 TaxID=1314783 RepID=A0A165N858_9APHY|nr:hypothetical protein DAEQUDRAFT_730055 [Daedalea quercina L-15889]